MVASKLVLLDRKNVEPENHTKQYYFLCRAIVKISNFTYSEFRTFLLYLYTDRVEPPPRTVEEFIGSVYNWVIFRILPQPPLFNADRRLSFSVEMFELADNYGEESLKRHCEEQLRALITTDNFSTVYAISIQYNAQVTSTTVAPIAISVQSQSIVGN